MFLDRGNVTAMRIKKIVCPHRSSPIIHSLSSQALLPHFALRSSVFFQFNYQFSLAVAEFQEIYKEKQRKRRDGRGELWSVRRGSSLTLGGAPPSFFYTVEAATLGCS
jgi:hypothetical protein